MSRTDFAAEVSLRDDEEEEDLISKVLLLHLRFFLAATLGEREVRILSGDYHPDIN